MLLAESVENGINNPKLQEEPAIPRCCWSLLHGKAGRSRQGHIHQLVARTEEPNPNQQGCHMQPCCWDRSHQYIKIEKEFDVPELGREWSEKRKDQAVLNSKRESLFELTSVTHESRGPKRRRLRHKSGQGNIGLQKKVSMKPRKGCFQDSTYDTKMFFEVTGAYDMVEDCEMVKQGRIRTSVRGRVDFSVCYQFVVRARTECGDYTCICGCEEIIHMIQVSVHNSFIISSGGGKNNWANKVRHA